MEARPTEVPGAHVTSWSGGKTPVRLCRSIGARTGRLRVHDGGRAIRGATRTSTQTGGYRPATKRCDGGLTKHATPHMLRHTTVVWSLAAGVRIEVVSEQLGHASLQITYDVYGGLINLHDPVMAEAMAREMLTLAQAIVPAPEPGGDRTTADPTGRP